MFKVYSDNKIVKEIVEKAFERSFSTVKSNTSKVFIFISPDDTRYEEIQMKIDTHSKILIFGTVTQKLSSLIGLTVETTRKYNLKKNIACLNQEKACNTSKYYVGYDKHELTKNSPCYRRYFTRFDFTDEWNNLGYGRIGTENNIWSVKQIINNKSATSLAQIFDDDGYVAEFITITNFDKSSVLYINREVGTVDGLDWSIVENFISRYRMDDLPCTPLILDVPYGFDAVVSPRLDCDQSVVNTKLLVELYKSYDIDLSLAISTGIDISKDEIDYLNDHYNDGGALLSHTINHFFDWGDCYETVVNEAQGSKQWIESNVKNLEKLEYAVSPFHTNKPYSVEALADVGYKGFISGIIHNDPEYLLGTSGQVPFTKQSIVSHSQQCMLHGDCYHRNNNSLSVYKESFKAHYQAGKMFGYLDHPFGDYDYGWASEAERLTVHKEFIEYINGFIGVKWMTSVEVLKFVYDKSQVIITINKNDELILQRESHESKEKIVVEYKGRFYVC